MAAPFSVMRPLGCLQSVSSKLVQPQISRRALTTVYSAKPEQTPIPEKLPQSFLSQLPPRFRPEKSMCLIDAIAMLIGAIPLHPDMNTADNLV